MTFPDAKRVIYRKNPLDQVICQLKFPPILRIETEVPAAFQERIRESFPEFREKVEPTLPIPHALPPKHPMDILRGMSDTKNYEFASEDGFWRINLARTFVALTCTKYEKWEQFQEKLKGPLAALIEVYGPTYFTRVGLRYVDIIRRSAIGRVGVDWRKLLQPYLLGLLGTPEVSGDIRGLQAKYEIRLDDNESVARVVAALVEVEEDPETCFMIDADFFSEMKTATEDITKRLDYFHVRASRLIQWLITKDLSEAMEPEELNEQ